MGDPKFPRRHYSTPFHPWDGPRILEEHQMLRKYGLKNKRELWRSQTMLSDLRGQARELQARLRSEDEQAIIERDALLGRLERQGLLHGDATLNDVLILDLEAVLARRLQTLIYLKGLARTMKQARQFITHGHIAINGRKVNVPGYLVPESEVGAIAYYGGSVVNNDLHPERPAKDFSPSLITVREEMKTTASRERETKRMREDRGRFVAKKLVPVGVSEDVDVAAVAVAGDEVAAEPLPEEPAEEGEAPEKGAPPAAAAPAGGKPVAPPAPKAPAPKAAAPRDAPKEQPARKEPKKPKGGEA